MTNARVALVTGGGSGIGAALCRRLADAGNQVVVADVDDDGAGAVADEIGGLALHLDVADADAWDPAVRAIIDRYGQLDAVALNAGTMIRPRGHPIDDDPLDWIPERYELVRGVNVDGVVHGIMATLPHLEAGRGHIAVTASGAGLKPLDMDPVYAMTKAAVIGLVRSIAAPIGERGVTIAAVCPGGVATPLVSPSLLSSRGDFASPDEIAAALEMVLALPADESGSIWMARAGQQPWPYEFAQSNEPH